MIIERMETIVIVITIVTTFIKISVCLLATCVGLSKIFNIEDYRVLAIPIGALMCNFTIFAADSVMQLSNLTSEIYPYYSFPFQVVLPIIIWIVAEIKNKSTRNNLKHKNYI